MGPRGPQQQPGQQQQQKLLHSGPVVLISGCTAGGIGASLAKCFASHGCSVFAGLRRVDAAGELGSLPGVTLVQLDVTDTASVQAVVARVVAAAGRIDILVNNAGIVVLGPTAEVPLDVVDAAFKTNVWGLLALTQAVVPHMVAQRSGQIINVGSLTGFGTVPLRGCYSATKGAVMRLSDALRVELQPLGVHVMLAAPGFIQSQARDTAHSLAETYCDSGSSSSGSSLWRNWLPVLEEAMRPRVAAAVPAHKYSTALVRLVLQAREQRRCSLPRYWVGPCAGIEWLIRWLPMWMQDWLMSRAMGLPRLFTELRACAPAT